MIDAVLWGVTFPGLAEWLMDGRPSCSNRHGLCCYQQWLSVLLIQAYALPTLEKLSEYLINVKTGNLCFILTPLENWTHVK